MVRVWRSAPAIDQADGTGRVLRPADRGGRPVGAPVGGAVMGCGMLPRWPACSSGSWLGAPVSGQLLGQTRLPKRIALPVFCRCSTDRDRIARPTGPDRRGPVQARHRVGAGSAWPCTAPGEVPSGSRADRQPHRPTRRRHHRDPHRSLRPAHLPGRYPATGRRAARHRPSDHCGTPSRGRSNEMPNVTIFGSARSLWQ